MFAGLITQCKTDWLNVNKFNVHQHSFKWFNLNFTQYVFYKVMIHEYHPVNKMLKHLPHHMSIKFCAVLSLQGNLG